MCGVLYPEAFTGNKFNLGIGGATSQELLDTVDTVITLNPDRVNILIGTNDISNTHPWVDEHNIRLIVERLQYGVPGVQITFTGILPNMLHEVWEIRYFSDILRDTVLSFKNVEYLDKYDLFMYNGRVNGKLYDDSVHLNRDGCAVLFNN
jgi:lysophospholipase L1-like esterase